MESLDVLEVRKDLNKKAFVKACLEPHNFADIFGITLLTSISAVSDNPFLTFYTLVYDISKVPLLVHNFYRYQNNIGDLLEVLKDTDIYKECEEEYRKYIKNLATFMKSLGLNDSLQASMYLTNIMRLGFLSKNMKCSYHRYKNDPLYTSDIMGARVFNGDYVCRHATKLLNDVLNEMGFKATMLSVKLTDDQYFDLPTLKRWCLKVNHAISGILDKDGKYAYDITNLIFANFTDVRNQLDVVNANTKNTHYLLPNKVIKLQEIASDYCEIVDHDNKILTINDVAKNSEYVMNLTAQAMDYLCDFYDYNYDMMMKIGDLEEQIAPRSDQMIKKWIIK